MNPEVRITESGKISVNTEKGSAVIPPELMRQLISDAYLIDLVNAKLLKLEQLKGKPSD